MSSFITGIYSITEMAGAKPTDEMPTEGEYEELTFRVPTNMVQVFERAISGLNTKSQHPLAGAQYWVGRSMGDGKCHVIIIRGDMEDSLSRAYAGWEKRPLYREYEEDVTTATLNAVVR